MSKWWCFFGVHEYEIIQHGRVSYSDGASGNYYDLRCKCCGKISTKST